MAVKSMAWPHTLGLHSGEWVVVRSREEILSTLDERGRLPELPFQPEMLAFCGQRLRVAKVAHKTCDNIKKTGGRKMVSAVHLEGARCDGAAHGGCMADCVFFWKEAWVKRPEDPDGRPLANRLIDVQRLGQCAVEGGDLSASLWAAFRDHRLRRALDPSGPTSTGVQRKLASRAASPLQPLVDQYLHAA